MSKTEYKRVLVKISGEMLGGGKTSPTKGIGIDGDAVEMVAEELAALAETGVQVAIVVGGGNIWRGKRAVKWDMDRTSADYMGMLATVINGLALQNVLEHKFEKHTRVLSAIHMAELCEPYITRKAEKHLRKGRIVIFAGGTGNPFFTTDTAASLRAREIDADVILKATKVDGVYDSDPLINKDAKRFDKLTYLETLSKNLGVMDRTAITMCMEDNIPIVVFKLDKPGCFKRVLAGEQVHTVVT